MRTAASRVVLCLIAALSAWSAASASAHPTIAKSLRERCWSEPVTIDHLSCANVYRTAYKSMRHTAKPTQKPTPAAHARYRVLAAAHRLYPKKSHRPQHTRVALALGPINRKQQQHHAPTNCHPGQGFQASAAHHPAMIAAEQHVRLAAVRRHQASAFCSHPAHRTSWECQRYFLLAPPGMKTR